jgi:cytochrome c oxidase subunit 4
MSEKTEKHHIVSFETYIMVAAALFILTGVTVGVSFIDLGGYNAIVAVCIASVKALLVAFIFMHLWFDKRIFLIIFATAIVFLGIFLSFTMFDILSRGDIYPEYEKPINPRIIINRFLY